MIQVHPKDMNIQRIQEFLLGGIGPRPIALVSTISTAGVLNLSPFSFFNAFGANPPMVAFSPSRRARDGSTKDTYQNLLATKECVIQAVTYDMVQQVSLSSTEYQADIDEFVKSGLTPVASIVVKPPRVKESPFQMECILQQMVPLGEDKGSGNLALCEVVQFHVAEEIMREGVIQPDMIDLVGRLSANYYSRASGDAVFEIEKPVKQCGIGFDTLPDYVRKSHILSANNLAQLANVESIPKMTPPVMQTPFIVDNASEDMFLRFQRSGQYEQMYETAVVLAKQKHPKASMFFEQTAKTALEHKKVEFAWQVLQYMKSAHVI